MKVSRTTHANGRSRPTGRGTYVYCVVASARRPSLARVPRGPAGLGAPRLVELPRDTQGIAGLWLVAADAPLDTFGEASLNRRISDVDWVSRAAVAHEGVVEAFMKADAVLPMKLFTIFASDERAAAHVFAERRRLDHVVRRVTKHDEWSVRVVLDRSAAEAAPARGRAPGSSGVSYLARKKAQRDARAELVERSRQVVADLYDDLAAQAGEARRRMASEMPVENGPLLLDAAFLVRRARAPRFRSAIAKQARRLQPKGYRLSLSGPWPPYSFLQDA